jgi:hypothetical protein
LLGSSPRSSFPDACNDSIVHEWSEELSTIARCRDRVAVVITALVITCWDFIAAGVERTKERRSSRRGEAMKITVDLPDDLAQRPDYAYDVEDLEQDLVTLEQLHASGLMRWP